NPICSSRGNVAPQAIFLVVGSNLLIGSVGFVQGPTPAFAPQWIARIAAFFVLDHHEPDFCSRSPVHVARCHLCVFGSEHFLHEDSPICELSCLAIVFRRARRGVSCVHLVTFWIKHHIRSEGLILAPVIWWFPNASGLVDQIETVVVVLRLHFCIPGESQESEYGDGKF